MLTSFVNSSYPQSVSSITLTWPAGKKLRGLFARPVAVNLAGVQKWFAHRSGFPTIRNSCGDYLLKQQFRLIVLDKFLLSFQITTAIQGGIATADVGGVNSTTNLYHEH